MHHSISVYTNVKAVSYTTIKEGLSRNILQKHLKELGILSKIS